MEKLIEENNVPFRFLLWVLINNFLVSQKSQKISVIDFLRDYLETRNTIGYLKSFVISRTKIFGSSLTNVLEPVHQLSLRKLIIICEFYLRLREVQEMNHFYCVNMDYYMLYVAENLNNLTFCEEDEIVNILERMQIPTYQEFINTFGKEYILDVQRFEVKDFV